MTRALVIFVRIVLIMGWGAFAFLKAAAAEDFPSVQILYNACVGSKENLRSFCFGYLSAAAQTWAHAGTRYGDANLTSMCREGATIQPPDLATRFTDYVEAHPEVKSRLATHLVFDLVCTEQK